MASGGAGPFEILEISAAGAYGAVAVARYRSRGGEVVALKVLKSDHLNRRRILGRTRDEARLLFKLRHPNIVRVHELIEVGGRPVLVMEWIEGAPLRVLIDRMGSLPLTVALELARQTSDALDAAYNTVSDGRPLRIIHRDLKPSNLLMSLDGALKVVDFGTAHGDFDTRETDTVSTIMGTQGYMAPERLDGVADTPAIDVYGLGITLHEMLVGHCLMLPRHPLRHDAALDEAVEAWAAEQVDAPAARGTADLVRRMCRWDHGDRPGVSEVQATLEELLAGAEPVDLAAFAAAHVVPAHDARKVVPPAEHAEYADLRFLEEPWEVTEQRVAPRPDEVPTTYVEAENPADRRVRRFLAESDWTGRIKELTWLLATNHTWTERPFLEVLDAAEVPWWKVWSRRSRPPEVLAALQMLRYRRTPEVLDRVRGLTGHADPRIARSALTLLDDPTDPG